MKPIKKNKPRRVNKKTQRKTPRLNGESYQVANRIINKLNSIKPSRSSDQISAPIRSFLRQLLFCESPKNPIPLRTGKYHYGVIRFQNTIQANTLGNCAIMGSIPALGRFDVSSTSSPILYANQASYDPAITTNSVTGGWNLNMINVNGTNFNIAEFQSCGIINAHVTISITGVSNLNKQGTIHIFEDYNGVARYGKSTDATQCNTLLNEYDVNSLPKCTHYRKYDLISLENSAKLRYSYIPDALYSREIMNSIVTYTTDSAFTSSVNSPTFGIIAQGVNSSTVLRVEYELYFVTDVFNDYINKYPVEFTNCYLNPNPLS